jgi:hypothetical protein
MDSLKSRRRAFELRYRVPVQFVLLRVLMTLVVQRGGGGILGTAQGKTAENSQGGIGLSDEPVKFGK